MEKKSRGAIKQSQMTQTLNWLSINYERADGVCLPRCVLYTHYLDFCKTHKFTPAGAATFGKIIRQRFPKLTTRRLGTRGQSKYHYYGIGIKESSIYYHSVYTGKGLTRFSSTKVKTEGSSRKYTLSSKAGTLLPELPAVQNIILPPGLKPEKVETLLLMYRTHCQRILDSVINANFEEVESLLLHFWQGMPDHLGELLQEDVMVDIMTFCDSVLYRVMSDVLLPPAIQEIPDGLGAEIKSLIRALPIWLENAMEDVPMKLKQRKLTALKTFTRTIGRHFAFINLAQTSRPVLSSQESSQQILADITSLDLQRITQMAAVVSGNTDQNTAKWIKATKYLNDLIELLSKQVSVETYTEWLDEIVDLLILKNCKGDLKKLKSLCGEFLLEWHLIGSLVMKELTMCSAASFGSCHLIHLMLNEYLMLVVETQRHQYEDQATHRAVNQYLLDGAAAFLLEPTVREPKAGRKRDREEAALGEHDEEEEEYATYALDSSSDSSKHHNSTSDSDSITIASKKVITENIHGNLQSTSMPKPVQRVEPITHARKTTPIKACDYTEYIPQQAGPISYPRSQESRVDNGMTEPSLTGYFPQDCYTNFPHTGYYNQCWDVSKTHGVHYGNSKPPTDHYGQNKLHGAHYGHSKSHGVHYSASKPHGVHYGASKPHGVHYGASKPHGVHYGASKPHGVHYGASRINMYNLPGQTWGGIENESIRSIAHCDSISTHGRPQGDCLFNGGRGNIMDITSHSTYNGCYNGDIMSYEQELYSRGVMSLYQKQYISALR